MKKLLLMAVLLMASAAAFAQNFQLHRDFGRNIYSDEEAGRQLVTLTYEQFKADKLGQWYWFIDLDMHHDGIGAAYTEISREFKFAPESKFSAHIEFDGGLNSSTRYQSAALIGPAYNGHNADFSRTWSVQAMYKQYFKGQFHDAYASLQLTGVWGINFADNRCTFSGFIDFWRGEQANGHGQLVMLSEPQFWYNFEKWKGFSIGGEIEVSNNFIFNTYNDKSFFINPTIAVKYAL
ncbi:MAG: DUF5020 family protein [Bacteroidales bacterium]|nr:DUF5020 family protein [Bacteroidales bacterium]